MPSIKGKVNKIEPYQTKFGEMWNVEVNGERFGFGKIKPKFSYGDYVSFDYTEKGQYKNAEFKSVQVLPAPSDSTPSGAPQGRPSSGGGSWDIAKDPKQVVISKQAARNSAIAAFRELRELGAIPIAASAKLDVKFDAACAILDKLTEDYYHWSMGIKDDSETADGSTDQQDEPWDQ